MIKALRTILECGCVVFLAPTPTPTMSCRNYVGACLTLNPVVGELLGSFLGLTLWGASLYAPFSFRTNPHLAPGFYICLFIATLWMLRAKGSQYTYAVTGIIFIFILNIVQTGSSAHLTLEPGI